MSDFIQFSTILGWNDIGIRKFKYVTETQFLFIVITLNVYGMFLE